MMKRLINLVLLAAVLTGFTHGVAPGPTPPPYVPGFAVAMNLSGLESQYPALTTNAEISYYAAHGFTKYRLPIGWSQPNPTCGTAGIQPTVNGPLDTTSTCVNYTPFGPNLILNSEALASAPWATITTGSGTVSETNNAGIAPDGSSTATSITFNRTSGSDYAVVYQAYGQASGATATGSIWLKACTSGDAGKVVTLLLSTNGGGVFVPVTLTNAWLPYSVTASNVQNVTYHFNVGYYNGDTSSVASVCALAAQAMVNLGSSPGTYQATVGGYLGAVDLIVAEINAAGGSTLLDVHTFGSGPGGFPIGSTQVPCTAFADLWGKISIHYKGMAGVRGYDLMNEPVNGFSSVAWQTCAQDAVTTIRANGDTTPIYVEGVNYSGGWNWVSGSGQPYNNANLYQVVDPLNRTVFSDHGYLDHDASGGNFSWALEIAKPGDAPPGTPTSATIGVTRDTPFVSWAQSHGLQYHHGEIGGSNDALAAGGNDNYAAWNTALGNAIAFAQTNNYEIDIWGGGANFGPGYPPYPAPSSVSNPSAPDFTSAGLQSTLMVLLEQYNGYSGSQPTAYRIDLPVTITATGNPELPTVTSVLYASTGVATGNFTIRYNGKITSPVTITLHDYLSDGTTSAGGTITPATVTLAAGNNAIAYFTYTPGQAATIKIAATNNAGWTDPPAVSLSSINDVYAANGIKTPTNIYGMYRRYTPYTGPAFLLRRATDNAQLAFSYNNLGNLPRAAIQGWASSTVIPVVTVYDQSPSGNTLAFTGTTLCNLQLNNSAGYPEIQCPSGVIGNFNTPINGQTATSVIAQINQSASTGGGLFRQDQYLGPLVMGSNYWAVVNTGYVGSTNIGAGTGIVVNNISNGIISGAYHEYAFTYASGATNGAKSFRDGSLVTQVTPSATIDASFTCTQTGTSLTVLSVLGAIVPGTDTLAGAGVAGGTIIASQTTGVPGGAGTYVTSLSGTASGAACTSSGIQYAINAAYSSQSTQFGYFLNGAAYWIGNWYNLEFEQGQTLTSGQIGAINTADATYYSTPLPDALPPLITGATNQYTVSGVASTPFAGVTITDANPGATDTVTITLTGNAATLSGSSLSGSNPYTLASASPATITSELRALSFLTTGSSGAVTNIAILVTSSTTQTASTSITDTITVPANPTISNMVAPMVSMDQGAPALWQVLVQDSNPNPMVSAAVTVSGSAGTMSHIGPYAPTISGSTYSFAAMTPAQLTRALDNLLWAPSVHTSGATTTFTLVVTNALSRTATTTNTITNAAPQAMPTPYTPVATAGTLPSNYKGLNFSGGENNVSPNYQTSPTLWSWAAATNFATIRLPFQFFYMASTATTPVQTPSPYQFQTQLYANFSTANISAIHTGVELGRANGQYVVLDDHAYGSTYNPFPTGTIDDSQPATPFLTWGTDIRVPLSAFTDAWQRMTTYFSLYSNILIGIENEPGIGGTSWYNFEVAGATGVRNASSTIPYLISGNNSNVTQFNYTPFTGYTDPAGGPFFFDVHNYFDNAGGSLNTCVSTPVTSYFSTFTTWLNAQGFKAIVSEFAWGTDASCMNTLGPSVVAYFNTNSNVYAGWQWWGGGDFPTSYSYYMGPVGTPPQLAQLSPYLP